MCNRFLSEAEQLIKQLNPTDGSNVTNADELERQIGMLLFRVKTGQPKSEGLMKILENPEHAQLMNRAELDLHKDQKKVELYREKEELLFAMDEKSQEADLTEKGRNFVSPKDPEAFVLPDLTTLLHDVDAGPEADARKRMEAKTKLQADFEAKAQKIHAISQLLKAYSLYQLDVEYVIQDNKVIIVDQHTGRLMPGRRWSDGLHQAVEAKEGVAIERETQTLATITIQNYFRLYQKLAGMTGTAETEAIIVTVPTPIDDAKQPDLSCLVGASETVGRQLAPARWWSSSPPSIPASPRRSACRSSSALRPGLRPRLQAGLLAGAHQPRR